MGRTQAERYFGADIPRVLWVEFESWADRHAKLSNRQILTGLFRLFLAAPEPVKLKAIFSKDEPIRLTEAGSDGLSADEIRDIRSAMRTTLDTQPAHPLEAISRILEQTDLSATRLLSPAESRKLEMLRRELAGEKPLSRDKQGG